MACGGAGERRPSMTWTGSTQEEPSPASGGSFLRRPPRHLLRPADAARLAPTWSGSGSRWWPPLLAGRGARSAADHRPRHLRDQRDRLVRGQRTVPPGSLDRIGPTADAAPGPHDDLLSHRGHGNSGVAADLARRVRAGLPDRGVGAGRRRVCRPHDVDGGARAAGRRGLRGLGWVAALALPGLWMHAGAAPAALVLAGGLLYTAGAICYRRRRPDPRPSVFGYHEVFHAFVCVAASASSPRSPSLSANQSGGRRIVLGQFSERVWAVVRHLQE